MSGLKRLIPVFVIALMVSALGGCDTEGPAERAGEQVDQTMEGAGEQMERSGEQMQDQTDR